MAWKAKMVTSAWWVGAGQVSKTAPAGEFLPTGSFMVRGKKNFLAPQPLEMGLGLLFKLDEGSVGRHTKERRERGEVGGEEEGGEGEEERRRQVQRLEKSIAALSVQPFVRMEEENDEGEKKEEGEEGKEEEKEEKDDENDDDEEEEEEDEEEGWAVAGTGSEEAREVGQTGEGKGALIEGGDEEADEGGEDGAGLAACGEGGGERGKGGQKGNGGRLSAKERRLLRKGVALGDIRARDIVDRLSGALGDQEQVEGAGEGGVEGGGEGGRERGREGGREGEGRLELSESGPGKRGKKGKMKKMRKKYAEQDAEDRELALQALGVIAPPNGPKKKGQRRGDGKKEGQGAGSAEAAGARLAGEVTKMEEVGWEEAWGGLPPWVRERIQEWLEKELVRRREDLGAMELRALAALPTDSQQRAVVRAFEAAVGAGAPGRRVRSKSALLAQEIQRQVVLGSQAHALASKEEREGCGEEVGKEGQEGTEEDAAPAVSRRAAAREEEEGLLALLEEEGVAGGGGEEEGVAGGGGEEEAEVEKEQRELRRLTGRPVSEDLLLFAMPVCAPYSALAPAYYKYRVKLTPGAQKKGKAAHQALEVFVRDREATPREVELIKGIADNELVAACLGDVQVSKPGIQAALLKAKRSKAKAKVKASRGR
jgi:hypothetical protein